MDILKCSQLLKYKVSTKYSKHVDAILFFVRIHSQLY